MAKRLGATLYLGDGRTVAPDRAEPSQIEGGMPLAMVLQNDTKADRPAVDGIALKPNGCPGDQRRVSSSMTVSANACMCERCDTK